MSGPNKLKCLHIATIMLATFHHRAPCFLPLSLGLNSLLVLSHRSAWLESVRGEATYPTKHHPFSLCYHQQTIDSMEVRQCWPAVGILSCQDSVNQGCALLVSHDLSPRLPFSGPGIADGCGTCGFALVLYDGHALYAISSSLFEQDLSILPPKSVKSALFSGDLFLEFAQKFRGDR